MVEVGTQVCRTPAEVRSELVRLRGAVMELADRKGYRIVAAGTHPFSRWETQEITPMDRYLGVGAGTGDMQDLAHQLLIFGTHVHIGIEDRDFPHRTPLNVSRYFLPHIPLVSAPAPPSGWGARPASSRTGSIIFRSLPRTGVPRIHSSWADYEHQGGDAGGRRGASPNPLEDLVGRAPPTGAIPTLEFRICDVCTREDEAVCVAAILQAIVYKLWKLRRDNITFRVYGSDMIEGEQVAGGALRPGGEAHRLREAGGSFRHGT